MKKTILNFVLIGALAPFLVQCASQSDVDDLRYQLRIVNKKIEDMKSTTVGQLQKRLAASSGQMDELGLQVLELKSQLEETGHLNSRLREQNKDLEQSIGAIASSEAAKRDAFMQRLDQGQREKQEKLNELNEQLAIQNENVKAIQKARIRDAELRAKSAARAAEIAKAKTRTANSAILAKSGVRHILADKEKVKFNVSQLAPRTENRAPSQKSSSSKTSQNRSINESAPTTPAKTVSASTKMAKAQKLFDKNKLNAAFEVFEQVAVNTSAKDSVDARYMMGECLFKQKEYDKAIMQYQKIISQHSEHNKASSAMFRQGMAFEKLSDKETAKVIYKKILKRHGSSPEASKAQERLDKL